MAGSTGRSLMFINVQINVLKWWSNLSSLQFKAFSKSSWLYFKSLPSGKRLHSYWKWPSRNSGYLPIKNGGSFHSFLYVYQSVLAQKNGPTSKPPIKVIHRCHPRHRQKKSGAPRRMAGLLRAQAIVSWSGRPWREGRSKGREDVLMVDG